MQTHSPHPTPSLLTGIGREYASIASLPLWACLSFLHPGGDGNSRLNTWPCFWTTWEFWHVTNEVVNIEPMKVNHGGAQETLESSFCYGSLKKLLCPCVVILFPRPPVMLLDVALIGLCWTSLALLGSSMFSCCYVFKFVVLWLSFMSAVKARVQRKKASRIANMESFVLVSSCSQLKSQFYRNTLSVAVYMPKHKFSVDYFTC